MIMMIMMIFHTGEFGKSILYFLCKLQPSCPEAKPDCPHGSEQRPEDILRRYHSPQTIIHIIQTSRLL